MANARRIKRNGSKKITDEVRKNIINEIKNEFDCEVDKLKYKYGMERLNPNPKMIVLSPDLERALVVLNVSQAFIIGVPDVGVNIGIAVEYKVRKSEAIFMYNTSNRKISYINSVAEREVERKFTRNYYERPTVAGEIIKPQKDGIFIGGEIKSIAGFGFSNKNKVDIIVHLAGRRRRLELLNINLDNK